MRAGSHARNASLMCSGSSRSLPTRDHARRSSVSTTKRWPLNFSSIHQSEAGKSARVDPNGKGDANIGFTGHRFTFRRVFEIGFPSASPSNARVWVHSFGSFFEYFHPLQLHQTLPESSRVASWKVPGE